ncbi:hypothetical protein LguiA_002955 [Lonicera macranthoides]
MKDSIYHMSRSMAKSFSFLFHFLCPKNGPHTTLEGKVFDSYKMSINQPTNEKHTHTHTENWSIN